MTTTKRETVFTKDLPNKKLFIERSFDAPLPQVWLAHTDATLLDQWWAPKPYRAITKTMDFREGGHWLYYMIGPTNDIHWCRVDYKTIEPQKMFLAENYFCDEQGVKNAAMPTMNWRNVFTGKGDTTTVNIELTFASEAELETIVQMGFKEGRSMGFNQLDEFMVNHKG